MKKSEVYSWRITSETKALLENQARRERTTISALLDRITKGWLESANRYIDDGAEQARLHELARKTAGTISGKDPRRAERARTHIQERLKRRYGR